MVTWMAKILCFGWFGAHLLVQKDKLWVRVKTQGRRSETLLYGWLLRIPALSIIDLMKIPESHTRGW
jgi:hypothetical protein